MVGSARGAGCYARFVRLVRGLIAGVVLGASALVAAPAGGEPPAGPRRGELATVKVDGDRPVFVVHGAPEDSRVLVYLHGRCGDPHAGIRAFAAQASEWGTLVSVQADLTCPDRKGRWRWSGDVEKAARRVDAAIDAVSRARGRALDAKGRTLIGYSEGALRAESIAKRHPDQYPRAILLASPRAPLGSSFTISSRVALVMGQRDVQAEMRAGDEHLEQAGVAHRLFTLTGARHGTYGTDAAREMAEVLAWLYAPGQDEATRSTRRE